MASQHVVFKAVDATCFGFYSGEEIRRLSVVQITQPDSFDSAGQPVESGLYDDRMGPLDKFGECKTCGLASNQCPGHLGHIELDVPVYNPLVFQTMLKLLKKKCFHCHHFRWSTEHMLKLKEQLILLKEGKFMKALSTGGLEDGEIPSVVDEILGKQKSTKEGDDESEDEDEADIGDLDRNLWDRREYNENDRAPPAEIARFRRELVKSFMRHIPKPQCVNCSGVSPAIRNEKTVKIFQSMSKKRQQLNEKNNMKRMSSVFDNAKSAAGKAKSDNDSDEDEDEDEELSFDDEVEEGVAEKGTLMPPNEVEMHMKKLWEEEKDTLDLIWGHMASLEGVTQHRWRKQDYRMFFLRTLAVPASRYRPPAFMNDKRLDHPHNAYLRKVLQHNQNMRTIASQRQRIHDMDQGPDEDVADKGVDVPEPNKEGGPGEVQDKEMYGRQLNEWIKLQDQVSTLIDSDKTMQFNKTGVSPGIRQVLEKKQGLFRQNMMGKRVNFAARSVVSPDPWIGTGDIGVPIQIAMKLTYPEPVTPFNIAEMRQAVINGSKVHPGANMVEDEHGALYSLSRLSLEKRKALAAELLTDATTTSESAQQSSVVTSGVRRKKVLRHLRNGDVVLMNRQPTLHKASMMAHKVKVQRGAQVLRLHYANCNTYNADFDGDEINMHFPQNEIARAEGYNIANTAHQYLTPKDASPLRNLMQDHVVGGVLMTRRDGFFTKVEYMNLVYSACLDLPHTTVIRTVPPAIIKPRQLWTGKQIITTILNLVAGDVKEEEKLTVDAVCKTPSNAWRGVADPTKEEGVLRIRQNDVLTGVLDKGHIGAASYGLVHAVYELYGPSAADMLLTSLARLLTTYVQSRGFTCGIDDLILKKEVDKERDALIRKSQRKGYEVAAEYSEVEDYDPKEHSIHFLAQKMRHTLLTDTRGEAGIDAAMKGLLNGITSSIISNSVPLGQVKPFPRNNFSTMIMTGGKGSKVNISQIACLLGQQELEGKRVPRMSSGKTLPSFPAYDGSSRAGGYITDRFLTGIRPQEYFFHCMAGREGLVDTAVKTSRSGYLQRCLVKHLECLRVEYDGSVRDTDGALLQFHFGTDGIDVLNTPYLQSKKFEFLGQNFAGVRRALGVEASQPLPAISKRVSELQRDQEKMKKKAEKYQRNKRKLRVASENVKKQGFGRITRYFRVKKPSEKSKALKRHLQDYSHATDPVTSSINAGAHVGAVSEAFEQVVGDYLKRNPHGVLADNRNESGVDKKEFEKLVKLKYLKSLVSAGEAVGVVAAQSLGEPSTQMTLNTFHLAGHGGANVTLGIPRLREIIMTASASIATPSMTFRMNPRHTRKERSGEKQAIKMKDRLCVVKMQDTLQDIQVHDRINAHAASPHREYKIVLQFRKQLPSTVTLARLEHAMTKRFLPTLFSLIVRCPGMSKRSAVEHLVTTSAKKRGAEEAPPDDDDMEFPRNDDDDDESDSEGEDAAEQMEDDEDEALEESEEDLEDSEEEQENDDSEDDSNKSSDSDAVEDEEDDDDDEEDSKPAKARPVVVKRVTLSDTPFRHRYFSGMTVKPAKGMKGVVVEITAIAPLHVPKLLMVSMVETASNKVTVVQTPQIQKAYMVEVDKKATGGKLEYQVQTDGVNFPALWKNQDLVNVHSIMSNDIAAVHATYGVEAANALIQREVRGVFGVYGIVVDARHLSLIADYMTYFGLYKPMNRMGITSNGSPFLKMTFETSTNFLTEAALIAEKDDMKSSAARLVLGRTASSGTGCFDLYQPLCL